MRKRKKKEKGYFMFERYETSSIWWRIQYPRTIEKKKDHVEENLNEEREREEIPWRRMKGIESESDVNKKVVKIRIKGKNFEAEPITLFGCR